jgi:mono/diheme cytochrome c family protein
VSSSIPGATLGRPGFWWRRGVKAGRLHLLGAIALLGLLAASCANGSYPLDFFYEMHYQQSYQSHEPPRLSPPASAVPITGKELFTPTNPIEGERVEEGERIFQINCVICHGPSGKGDGKVLEIMRTPKYGYRLAPDLSSDLTSTDGAGFAPNIPDSQVFAWITAGVSNGMMPSFSKLLTVEERWLLVNYIRTLEEKE